MWRMKKKPTQQPTVCWIFATLVASMNIDWEKLPPSNGANRGDHISRSFWRYWVSAIGKIYSLNQVRNVGSTAAPLPPRRAATSNLSFDAKGEATLTVSYRMRARCGSTPATMAAATRRVW